ncbi:MAG: amino acid ABC transporter substrate-binding protein, partial [Candidatus Dadabacteria bacterium]|nr:amino acid ABC transporter substrate-binding protein [Candidatus Dadabacteria bacterium]NIS09585.1 amino acid ABC transporter substrate-binding protein [Candidatus Dadabacteria bacterium]NIV43111.1 ABC transporter substrate-binding protein [Candidatus Dadabacteria bacterium]NIX16067.1 ABC transporter substrate-binding protein [Candidatus Dadabacteria bacterium]NIY22762.1 ABC transporter substrate-binding protein [Candidatus Dadabacteria bacterium]
MLVFISSSTNLYSQQMETETKEPERLKGIIRVGCLLPLSGKYEKLGSSALRGVFSAVEKVNDHNYNFQIVVKDFEEDAAKLRKSVFELVNEDNVSLIIGPIPSSYSKDVYSTVASLKIPTLIFPVSYNLAPENPYFIKYSFPIEKQTEILVKHAVEVVKVNTFGVLYPKTTIGELFKNSFVKNVKKYGKEVKHVASYDPDLSDIDTEIEWLSLVEPQGIFIPDGASRSRKIMLKLKNKVYIGNTLFMGPNTWNSASFQKDLGSRIDAEIFKVLFTDYFYTKSESWVRFNEHFRAVIGDDPGFLEFQVYEGTKLVLDKLKGTKGSRDLLLKNIVRSVSGPRYNFKK